MEKSDKEKKKQKKQERNPMAMPPKAMGSDEPWLVFFHGKRGQYQTFYSISEDQYHVKNIPFLRRKFIYTSSHGWMVLTSVGSDECFLLNPTTMEEIQLPPRDFRARNCVLSSSPDDPSCTVLCISYPRDDVIIFKFFSPKKCGSSIVDRWIKQEVKFENACIKDATSYNGKIYMLMGCALDILIGEVVDNTTLKFTKIETEPWELMLEGPINIVLVIDYLCGEVYVVWKIYAEEYNPGEIQVFEVLKLDFTRKCWERVKSLGNRALFLGPRSTSCFASAKESESSGIMGNTIYFTMEEDRSLYAFNLEEKIISVSLPCPNVQHDWSQPNWVVMLPSSCSEEE